MGERAARKYDKASRTLLRVGWHWVVKWKSLEQAYGIVAQD